MTDKEIMDKKQQRKLAAERRRALTHKEREEKSRVICDHLINLIKDPRFCTVKTIFSYRAIWEEVNVDAFNNWAEEQGYRVAYPISLANGIMKAAVPAENDAWHRAAYGILEPVMEKSVILEPKEIDMVIVPCVAFDQYGNRCGHGAGYYDRFMVDLAPESLVLTAFEAQKLEKLVTEETDIPIRTIVTEAGVTDAAERSLSLDDYLSKLKAEADVHEMTLLPFDRYIQIVRGNAWIDLEEGEKCGYLYAANNPIRPKSAVLLDDALLNGQISMEELKGMWISCGLRS